MENGESDGNDTGWQATQHSRIRTSSLQRHKRRWALCSPGATLVAQGPGHPLYVASSSFLTKTQHTPTYWASYSKLLYYRWTTRQIWTHQCPLWRHLPRKERFSPGLHWKIHFKIKVFGLEQLLAVYNLRMSDYTSPAKKFKQKSLLTQAYSTNVHGCCLNTTFHVTA